MHFSKGNIGGTQFYFEKFYLHLYIIYFFSAEYKTQFG